MAKFLVDANLPYYFALWNSDDYIHQIDLQQDAKDSQVWEYAQKNNLTIITKDVDFSNLIMLSEPPPKVIHVRFGNVRMKEFHRLIKNCWSDVITMSQTHKLVQVYKDAIEGIR